VVGAAVVVDVEVEGGRLVVDPEALVDVVL
jgi:hypothetical protein